MTDQLPTSLKPPPSAEDAESALSADSVDFVASAADELLPSEKELRRVLFSIRATMEERSLASAPEQPASAPGPVLRRVR